MADEGRSGVRPAATGPGAGGPGGRWPDDRRPAATGPAAPVAPVAPPEGYHLEHVGAVPPLGRTYRKVLTRAVTSMVGARPVALPAVALTADPVRADAEHLTAYQHLVGAEVDDHLPPGYVHVLAFPLAVALMARSDFPFPPLGMVHVANHVTQVRRAHLGEELTVTTWAHSPREHRRGTTVELSVAVTDGAGEQIWSGRSTYLSRGQVPAGMDRGPARERQVPEPPDRPQALWSVLSTDIHTYAHVSGDHNPIHTSVLGARAFGFPRRIAHGMYTAARALHATARPRALVWDVEFGAPLLIPGSAAFSQVRAGEARQSDGAGTTPGVNVTSPGGKVAPGERHMVTWSPRNRKVHVFGHTRPLDG